MDILVYFYLHPTSTRNDYISSDDNISEGGTKSSIARLQELELLKRKGGKKNGEWIVAIDIPKSRNITIKRFQVAGTLSVFSLS